jgi:transposase
VTAKQPVVKKYIVRLSAEERQQLTALIQTGKRPARQVLKARILLKADASDAGEGWSDGQIAKALDTSIDTVARTRQQLVEGGLDAALTRKHSPRSARRRVFDGAAEAKLIALACSEPPKGRARWTLKLLEKAVVELHIVARASDNTIGRTLKKTRSSRICRSNGSFRPRPTPPS